MKDIKTSKHGVGIVKTCERERTRKRTRILSSVHGYVHVHVHGHVHGILPITDYRSPGFPIL